MPYQHNTGFIFGTVYHITYQNDEDLQPEIDAELKRVNQTFSTFEPSSVISLINQNKPVKINEMFEEVFTLAQQVSKETNGAFDITVAPMVNMWGFGFKTGVHPSKEKIDSLRQIVGFNKVKLVGNTIRKQNPRIMLDCSAIAKGYGSDCVARLLERRGVKNFMI